MNDFKLFVLNCHQLFFGVALLSFITLFLRDVYEIKASKSLEQRKFLTVLFGALTIGTFTILINEWGEQGLFFALEFSLLITLSLLNPVYAVSFLVYLLLSRPWESFVDPMMASMPRDISILAILSILGHKILRREFYFKFNASTSLIIVLSIWLLLSAVFSHHVDFAMKQYVEIFSKGVILFILIQNCVRKPSDLIAVKVALIIGILEKSIVSYYKTFIADTGSIDPMGDEAVRLVSVGVLGNSNDIAAIFVLAIPFAFFSILKTKLKPFNWIFAFGLLGVLTKLIWAAQSRGALLALFATIGAWFFLKIKNKTLIAIVLVLSLVAALGTFKLMDRGGSDLQGSTSNRIIFWKAGANMAVRNPVFGVGINGFHRYLSEYAIDGVVGSDGEHMTAHSSWVLVLAEGGFIAFFSFFGLWVYSGIKAYRLKDSDPEYFTAIVGYGVAMSFLSHTYLLYPYILTAMVTAHYFAVEQEKKEEVSSELEEQIIRGTV